MRTIRSREEIIFNLLEIAYKYKKVKKQSFLLKGNVSTNQLNGYLDFFLNNDLLNTCYVGKIKHYTLSDKGLKFYFQLSGMIKEYGLFT